MKTTDSELTPQEIQEEFQKLKIPKFIVFAEKFWFKLGRYIMFFGLIAMFPFGIIINQSSNPNTKFILSQIALYLFFFLLIGLGGLMLVSHLIEKRFVKKHRNRLGLSLDEWNHFAEKFNLTSY